MTPREYADDWWARRQASIEAQARIDGEPWENGRNNRWKLQCPTCGQDVEFGWDDGFGWPERGTLESECEHCGTIQEHTWDMEITVNRGHITTEGKAPRRRDERGRFIAA